MIMIRKRNKIHDLHLLNGVWCIHDTILREETLNFLKSFLPTFPILYATMGESNMTLILTEKA